MLDNVIIKTSLQLIWKVLVIYSVYMMLRGHNEPGGGFIGGLLLALGLIVRDFTKPKSENSIKQSRFPAYIGGLCLGFLAVLLAPAFMDQPILTGLWTAIWVPIAGKFSSVLLFDVVVFLVVAVSSLYAYAVLSGETQEEQS
ncbi:MAG: hypothetical protein HRU19_19185 [Pseudobacteriovorax sp.]|nr:hypothetical protein [Pseudobacteriovorax sp.]